MSFLCWFGLVTAAVVIVGLVVLAIWAKASALRDEHRDWGA